MLKNSHDKYGWISILFHWISALVIIGLFASGLWMEDMNYYNEWYTKAPFFHKSVGIIFLILICFRFAWRFLNTRPEFESTINLREQKIALTFQRILYLLMFITPIAGYFVATSKGHSVEVFSWFKISAIMVFDNSKDIVSDIHAAFAWSVMVLAIFHGAAAFKHHFVDKDSTLRKMLGIASKTK